MIKKHVLLVCSVAVITLLASCTTSSVSSSSNTSSSIEQTPSSSSTSSTIEKRTVYCSPDGIGVNEGTSDSPWSIIFAFSQVKAGDTLIVKAGTYDLTATLMLDLGRNGTEENPIQIFAEEGVLLDFSRQAFNSSARGISINGDWYHVKGFEIKGAGDNGIYIGGHHNIVEDCEVYACRDTGIQLGRAGSQFNEIADWPSYNTILNCTSYDNSDPRGEDSDGFACKLTTGVQNKFIGCIAYNNIDDGWDLYTKGDTGEIGYVTMIDCVAFNNGITTKNVGTKDSDGNGFKLGGERIAVPHVVQNCIAFNNLAHGFTDNSNPGPLRLENCTSYNNSIRDTDCNNIDMARDNASNNYFKNILSYSSGTSSSTGKWTREMTNSKDQFLGTANYSVFFTGLTTVLFGEPSYCDYSNELYRGTPFVSEQDPFVSTTLPDVVNERIHDLFRNEDGSINLGDFLRVNPNSDFYTLGENQTPLGANLHGKRGA